MIIFSKINKQINSFKLGNLLELILFSSANSANFANSFEKFTEFFIYMELKETKKNTHQLL